MRSKNRFSFPYIGIWTSIIYIMGEKEDMTFFFFWTTGMRLLGISEVSPPLCSPWQWGFPSVSPHLSSPWFASISWSCEPSPCEGLCVQEKLKNCRCFLLTMSSEQRWRPGSLWVISQQEVFWSAGVGLLNVGDHCSLGSPWQNPLQGLRTQNGERGGNFRGSGRKWENSSV